MKKKLLIGTLGAALVFGGAFAVSAAKNDTVNAVDYTTKNEKTVHSTISQADAAAIAEKTVNGKVVEIERDEDDGFIKYEVELKTGRGEAEVDIDAYTGKVLDVEYDD